MSTYIKSDEHRGGQLGLIALVSMLTMTSCATFAQQSQSGGLSGLPGWAQVTGQQQQTLPAQAATVEQPAATFIVRFNNEPGLDEVYKNFRRNPAASRAKFSVWSSG
ncbi:MAG: hypothetical protein L3J02_04365, partial [Henriciella sp.]|nr:hypothetical protein [Henriciella sp.]